MTKVANEHVI